MEQEHFPACTGQTTPEACSRKPKLKFSCDACAKSKLKCGRQQPTCQRCSKQGVPCVYSPARRTGKRRARPSLRSSVSQRCPAVSASDVPSLGGQLGLRDLSISAPSSIEEAASLHLSSFWEPRFFVQHAESLRAPDYSHRLAMTAMEDRQLHAWKTYGAESRGSLGLGIGAFPVWNDSTYIESNPNLNLASETASGLDSFALDPPAGSDSGSLADDRKATLNCLTMRDLAESKKSPSPTHTTPNDTPIAVRESCALLAVSILRDVHNPSTPCASASYFPNSRNYDIDYMLQTATEATEKAMTILQCRCSLDSHLTLLLTLISSEILSSYELIAQKIMEYWNPVSTKSNSASNLPTSLPINIGSFKLDAADERKMILQLILIKLGKVRDLQAAFMKKYLSLSGGDGKEQLYLVCMTFLETKLKSVMRVLIENLSRST